MSGAADDGGSGAPVPIMADPAAVEAKIKALVAGGPGALQAIFDYDMTLTGLTSAQSWDMLSRGGVLEDDYHTRANALFAKYHPIEQDPSTTREAKEPLMVEWWNAAHAVLLDQAPTRNMFRTICRNAIDEVYYREHVDRAFETLDAAAVPTVVFSAGLGDVIRNCLKLKGLWNDHICVASNCLRFPEGDDDAPATGFIPEDPIHVYNKSESSLGEVPLAGLLEGRRNVILAGDSEGDYDMADGVDAETVLRIGFLNHHVEERMEHFCQLFDVVFVETDDFSYVADLVDRVVGGDCGDGGNGV